MQCNTTQYNTIEAARVMASPLLLLVAVVRAHQGHQRLIYVQRALLYLAGTLVRALARQALHRHAPE